MKVTIEFNLPEERGAHTDAIHGSDWRCVVQEMDNWLRDQVKYRADEHGFSVTGLELARKELHELIDDRGLDLWAEG